MMQRGTQNKPLIGLYLRNLGANVLGLTAAVLLNLFTPLDLFKDQRDFLVSGDGWILLSMFYPAVLLMAAFLQYVIQRPISQCLSRLNSQGRIDVELWRTAGRRLLNLPFILALVSLAMWIVVPAFFVVLFSQFLITAINISLFLFLRAVMIGMISSTLVFFLVEEHVRMNLIPKFFPAGRLWSVPQTIRIPVLGRILVLYASGTLVPMIILVGTMFLMFFDGTRITVSAKELAEQILVFVSLLCAIFFVIALRLSFLVGRSVTRPIDEIVRVIKGVREGAFAQRIRVVSSDEIGVLGDAGNDMIEGLAERERIRDTFGKYVTPEIRDEILTGRISLDGDRREATLLFSDLRDFTAYVNENDPEEVIKSMRDYFSAMEKAIQENQGIVLQYVGDEIEAVFGVPIQKGNHANQAVRAALDMRERLQDLNSMRISEGRRPFAHGIGIHSGEVLAGNIGSEDRLFYALIGDTVNLASRIQDLTKEQHCDILISEDTRRRLKAPFPMDRGELKKAKGHAKPVVVYRIL